MYHTESLCPVCALASGYKAQKLTPELYEKYLEDRQREDEAIEKIQEKSRVLSEDVTIHYPFMNHLVHNKYVNFSTEDLNEAVKQYLKTFDRYVYGINHRGPPSVELKKLAADLALRRYKGEPINDPEYYAIT